jgi:hypothetical protein
MISAAKPKPISRQGRCRDDQLPPSFEPLTLYQNLSHSNIPTLNHPGHAHIEGYGRWDTLCRTRAWPRANSRAERR